MINSLVAVVSWLQEWKTGRPAVVTVKAGFILGFGYIRDADNAGLTETYFCPFIRLTIFQATLQ